MAIKIKVSPDLCCGAALCAKSAPEVYHLDEHGYNMMDGQFVAPGHEDAARAGEEVCPEGAIELIASPD